jgi:hypothetical protein
LSGEDAANDFAEHIRQAKVAARVAVGYPLVIEAEQVQDRSM